jgi:carboxypeptidase family protein
MATALLFMCGMNRQARRRFAVKQLVLPAVLAAGLLSGSGCHANATMVSISSAAIGGTIAGVVTGPADATLGDRTVTIVNVETGQRYQTATGQKGGYSLRVPPGTYRLEVQLRPGERLSEMEPTILLNTGDREIHKDVTVNQDQQ